MGTRQKKELAWIAAPSFHYSWESATQERDGLLSLFNGTEQFIIAISWGSFLALDSAAFGRKRHTCLRLHSPNTGAAALCILHGKGVSFLHPTFAEWLCKGETAKERSSSGGTDECGPQAPSKSHSWPQNVQGYALRST